MYKQFGFCVSPGKVIVVLSISTALTAPFSSSAVKTVTHMFLSSSQNRLETTLLIHSKILFLLPEAEFCMCSLNCANCACVLLHFSLKHLATIKCCDCAPQRFLPATFLV